MSSSFLSPNFYGRALLVAALVGFAHAIVPAGPVPGVESIEKRPVDFPTPPGIEAWQTAEDDYLVTFRYTPETAGASASIAGSFNNWDARDLPMVPGPDGALEVTARLPAGVHQYKVVADGAWLTDPLNPNGSDDGHGGMNSVLKLGLFAKHENLDASRGDGELIAEAFLHDPANYTYRDFITEDEVILRFRTLREDAEAVALSTDDGNYPMRRVAHDETYEYWEVDLPLGCCELPASQYTFSVKDGDLTFEYGKSFQLHRPSPEELVRTPDWARDAVWYQIMVDRFRDGDPTNNPEALRDPKRPQVTHPWTSDWDVEQPYERENGNTMWQWSVYNRLYGGDFAGLMEKLDYLQSLGINAIYLNPVFEAHTPHKYNARDYRHADDGYGTAGEYRRSAAEEDLLDTSTWQFNESDRKLLALINEVHRRGMRIIFDGVFNHVGDDHPAFLDVKTNGPESRFADWFRIESWEPFEYRGWAGFGGLPEFAKTETGLVSESLTQHIYDVTARWMDPNGDGDPSDGIDGWRLDVPNELPKAFWVNWREHVKSINPDAYIVGEIWDPAEQWLDGTTFDAVMNYQLAKAVFQWFGDREKKTPASEFANRLERLRLRYPESHTAVMQNLYDSHDTDRWVSRLANPDHAYDTANRIQDGAEYSPTRPSKEAYDRLRLMALFQATYIGAPMIYYGTEIGMFGADDPQNRMPMWWEDQMPFDDPEYTIDAELRDYFRDLFSLRHQVQLLRRGHIQTAIADDGADVYGFYRFHPNSPDVVLVLINNSSQRQKVTLNANAADFLPMRFAQFIVLHGDATVRAADNGGELMVTIPPISGAVIQISREQGH